MTGTQLQSILETGSQALLLTFTLVAAYVILRRMASQMRKGVDLATQASIKQVEVKQDGRGGLLLRIECTQGIPRGVSVAFELSEGFSPEAEIELNQVNPVTEVELRVPDGAKAIAIISESEKIIRPLRPVS